MTEYICSQCEDPCKLTIGAPFDLAPTCPWGYLYEGPAKWERTDVDREEEK